MKFVNLTGKTVIALFTNADDGKNITFEDTGIVLECVPSETEKIIIDGIIIAKNKYDCYCYINRPFITNAPIELVVRENDSVEAIKYYVPEYKEDADILYIVNKECMDMNRKDFIAPYGSLKEHENGKFVTCTYFITNNEEMIK